MSSGSHAGCGETETVTFMRESHAVWGNASIDDVFTGCRLFKNPMRQLTQLNRKEAGAAYRALNTILSIDNTHREILSLCGPQRGIGEGKPMTTTQRKKILLQRAELLKHLKRSGRK
ncbi:MAG TPA: hypothetical protein VNU68_10745 [Verrucomicrobiae bacterium]|nr:hypothetical protein [Verrucomicrobiae bacterium]